MNTTKFHIHKKRLTLLLAAVYVLLSVAVVFVLPKNNKAHFDGQGRTFAKVSNEGMKAVKNALKRSDKVASGNRKLFSPAQFSTFTLFAGTTVTTQTISTWLRALNAAQLRAPRPPGHLLNCCYRI